MRRGRISVDEARLRPHLRDRGQFVRQQADVLQAEYDRADTTATQWKTPAGDEWLRRRGLPMIGRVPGAILGSDPVQALLQKEARRKARPRVSSRLVPSAGGRPNRRRDL